MKNTTSALKKYVTLRCREIMGVVGLDKWISSLVAPCGKKTKSGRMLGCVIFIPQLADVVNWGVRKGVEAPLHCTSCVGGGRVIRCLRGVGYPTLWDSGERHREF